MCPGAIKNAAAVSRLIVWSSVEEVVAVCIMEVLKSPSRSPLKSPSKRQAYYSAEFVSTDCE